MLSIKKYQPKAWFPGQLLAFSGLDGQTDFDHGLVGRTSFSHFGIDIELPGKLSIQFEGDLKNLIWLTGDFFEVETDVGTIKGVFVDCHHLLIEGQVRIDNSNENLQVFKNGKRTLIGSAKYFVQTRLACDIHPIIQKRQKWVTTLDILDEVPSSSLPACVKALSLMKTQVCTPEGKIAHWWTTPDRWPHRNLWLWDSVFHAIGWRHVDAALAREMITAVFDNQQPDGLIPIQVNPHFVANITQPPVLALGVKLVHEIAPDLAWIEKLYPKLVAYIKWDFAHRDSDGNGLCEWDIEGDPNCRSGESGMDNSPRFDSATQLDAVDFNAFLALECEIMSEFASALNLSEEAVYWREKHQELCTLINEYLWSEEAAFYVDRDVGTGKQSSVLASSGFLPLICKAASPEQARCIADHLANPETFHTTFPVASVARINDKHYSKDMWRGPTWINLNWLVIYGFRRYGMVEIAQQLQDKTISVIEQMVAEYGVFFEFFDDRLEVVPPELHRKGKCAPEISPYHQVFHDFGWSATLYLDLIKTSLGQNSLPSQKDELK